MSAISEAQEEVYHLDNSWEHQKYHAATVNFFLQFYSSSASAPKNEQQVLVGGLVAIFYFPIIIGLLIIPIDDLIFFRGVAQTTNQSMGKFSTFH